jgi:lysyl-tRNA synthetase class 2
VASVSETDGDWRPAADLSQLRVRARLLAGIRAFFAGRDVLEVETPVLAAAGVTDIHIDSLSTRHVSHAFPHGIDLYLQTSPEYAMKRLLAAGSGSIYQISKVFRDGEAGRQHNPEFTMLEWYRQDHDYRQLMDEVAAMLQAVTGTAGAERASYRDTFLEFINLDPLDCSVADLRQAARQAGVCVATHEETGARALTQDDWLDLLLGQVIGPKLGHSEPRFIYDFPASQAALARVRSQGQRTPVAERFELYWRGLEIANGYQELVDAAELQRRMEQNRQLRRQRGLVDMAPDERLLRAMQAGLPECSGVALGVDRLQMAYQGLDAIALVMAFPVARA